MWRVAEGEGRFSTRIPERAPHKSLRHIMLCTTSSFGKETPISCARAWKPFNKPLP